MIKSILWYCCNEEAGPGFKGSALKSFLWVSPVCLLLRTNISATAGSTKRFWCRADSAIMFCRGKAFGRHVVKPGKNPFVIDKILWNRIKIGKLLTEIRHYQWSPAQSAPPQVVLGGFETVSKAGSIFCWLQAFSRNRVATNKRIFFMVVSKILWFRIRWKNRRWLKWYERLFAVSDRLRSRRLRR